MPLARRIRLTLALVKLCLAKPSNCEAVMLAEQSTSGFAKWHFRLFQKRKRFAEGLWNMQFPEFYDKDRA